MTIRTILPPRGRDYRLDLLRGFANWAIYLDHIPNNAVNWLTQRNYGFSDAADLFVFISGYTASFVFARIMLERGFVIGSTRLIKRAWQIYVAHIYGFFAVTIAEVFFPASNSTVSLLITFGTFGLAYVVRPLGAVIVGTYTDRAGRKAGLTLSIGLMMIGTTLMVITPGYATIGIAAPIIITAARLLQGFSVGGEFGSAVAFLVEHGGKRKGFSASWQWATTGIVSIIVSLFGVI